MAITNFGTITGGKANAGSGAQADAIDFTGGTNSLTLNTATANGGLSGGLGLGGTVTITPNAGGTTLASVLHDYSGTATGSLAKAGDGMLTLTGQNSYTGTTSVTRGTLRIGDGTTTGNAGQIGQSGSTFSNVATTGGTLAFDRTDAAGYTYGGVISGTGTVAQMGAGTTILTGVNGAAAGQFDGTVDVTAGILSVGGTFGDTGSLATATVNVGDGATANSGTLHGSGTIAAKVNVMRGGTISAGNSPGVLNTGNLTLASGATFLEEIAGATPAASSTTGYDRVNVTGTVDLGGATLNVSLLNNFAPTAGQTYTIIINDGTDAVQGTFVGANGNALAEGSTVTVNGVNLVISYKGGDGNDVTLTDPVPPPPSPTPPANPTIAGTHATADTGEAPVQPFAGVTVGDTNAGATETLTITPSGAGGTLADGAGFTGLTSANGVYTLTGTAAAVTAELDALQFTPANPNPGATVSTTFTLADASSAGTSATDSNTVVADTAAAVAPTIAGTHATADSSQATVQPFGASAAGGPVVIADSNANATETLTIAPSGAGGTLTDGAGYGGLTMANGVYTLTGTAAAVTAELDALQFTPVNPNPGTTVSTTFTLTDASSAGTSATDGNTVVTDTAAPGHIPNTPDAVSISPVVSYAGGTFTLTGTASAQRGVARVEISAEVDGVLTDLGAATVDANGNFSFKDALGARTQAFFSATVTDDLGGTGTGADPGFSLQGGLPGGRAEQDRYTADGSAVTATDVFGPRGRQSATLFAPGGDTFASSFFDTFRNGEAPLSTFVFDPGFGRDVVSGFRPDNVDHDTLSFKGSDYGNSVAAVLNASQDTAAGLLITDPVPSSPGGGPGTQDTLLLRGITKRTLTAYAQQDIAFHA